MPLVLVFPRGCVFVLVHSEAGAVTLLLLPTVPRALLSDSHLHQCDCVKARQGDGAGEKEKYEMKRPIMRISIKRAGIYASAIKDCP